ncbi:RNA polymerase sigma factor [uncultured Aquimarina sp.]|uniref:RNA polymerase sigma factor n=1 Tax=uncultured Aquimarina sp. TaxID=575652 RepID=UPI0026058331|nr:hypothetical protein [uncultured Aquimarina sp.]
MNRNKLEKIVEQARQGNELPFDYFFKDLFKRLQPRLLSLTKSPQETEEIFISAMQKFWERFVIQEENLPINSLGYIYQMCKNNWLMNKRNPWNSFALKDDLHLLSNREQSNNTYSNDSIEDLEQEWLQNKALSQALDALSDKCKMLMQSEINPEIKLKDLQQELGFGNYQALVQAKYNCKKRLIKKVYEIFDQLIAHKQR